MRAQRFEHGSVTLNKPKLAFKLNESTGLPESCFAYEIHESNQLIEEFMLLANKYVAKRIFDAYPDRALLRHHPKPLDRKIKEAVKQASKYGIKLNAATSGELQASLDAVCSTFVAVFFFF